MRFDDNGGDDPNYEPNSFIQNIVNSLGKTPKEIQRKMVEHFRRADKNYGDGVAKGLGL
jgi:catalase